MTPGTYYGLLHVPSIVARAANIPGLLVAVHNVLKQEWVDLIDALKTSLRRVITLKDFIHSYKKKEKME